VAHTFDDQVETALMKLITGAPSLPTLGMQADRELETAAGRLRILRPFLSLRRAELAALLDSVGLPHLHDPTNEDLRFLRNRVRHRVLPELEQLDPGFGKGLLRAVQHASRDADLADTMALEAIQEFVCFRRNQISINRAFLRDYHPAITSRVISCAARRLVHGDQRELTFERIEAVRKAAAGRTGALIELPYDLVARVERAEVVVSKRQKGMSK
jgi:tRNA(Ile)-lysidine synthase